MNSDIAQFVGNNALRFTPTVPLAMQVMKNAQGHFDAAETYNGKDWSKFYKHIATGVRLEAAAQLIQQAYFLP